MEVLPGLLVPPLSFICDPEESLVPGLPDEGYSFIALLLALSLLWFIVASGLAPSPSQSPSLNYGLLLHRAQRRRGPATKVRYQNNRGDGLVLIVIRDVTLWKSY